MNRESHEHEAIVKKIPDELFRTVDISGMGGAYELCCQWLLWNAYLKLRGRRMSDEEIYEWLKTQSWVDKARPSGVQVVAVSAHLAVILNEGYSMWLAKVARDEPRRIYFMNWKLLNAFEKCYLEK